MVECRIIIERKKSKTQNSDPSGGNWKTKSNRNFFKPNGNGKNQKDGKTDKKNHITTEINPVIA